MKHFLIKQDTLPNSIKDIIDVSNVCTCVCISQNYIYFENKSPLLANVFVGNSENMFSWW